MSKVSFCTFTDAVLYVLESTDIGTKSNLQDLVDLAYMYYEGPHLVYFNQVACKARSNFRKAKKLKGEDCRTYNTQTRRDMRSDIKMPRDRWNKVQDLLEKVPVDELKELLEQFHSIDQAKLAVSTYVQTAEFVSLT